MALLKSTFLGKTDDGVKMRSEFLSNCNVEETYAKFQKHKISLETAPIFIDYWSDEDTLKESIGVTEEVFTAITGEEVMDASYYEREQFFVEDVVFGAMINQLEERGVKIPDSDFKDQCNAALELQKFRSSDHVLLEVDVDDLSIEKAE